MSKTNLIGLSFDEISDLIEKIGEKPFRAKQLWHWVYHRGATDFADMTTLAKPFRKKLSAHFTLERPEITSELSSKDGARKWLLRFDDDNEAESVFIPEDDRGALCLSSQIGCTLTCSFCHTGTQLLVRNLTAAEIVSQVMVARDTFKEWPNSSEERLLSNIVVMGMGEPFFNFDEVAKALRIIMDREGIAISKRRITMSTSGVVPMIERCGKELGVNLAISLHAAHDELRNTLMPINKKYPIKDLMRALHNYPTASNARRITIEYIMLKGVNDSPQDARALARLVSGLPVKFNLIPFNAWPGVTYSCSTPSAMRRFAAILNDAGYSAPIRASRGRDIMAACGQLRSESQRARTT
jgi:23S rRNA (adenine2503-C2)-methyltransferase